MRSRRRVTLQPTFCPSRSLNAATDLRARMTIGRWPAIRAISSAATSIFLLSWVASPTPMLTTILTRRGISIGFLYPNSSTRAVLIVFS